MVQAVSTFGGSETLEGGAELAEGRRHAVLLDEQPGDVHVLPVMKLIGGQGRVDKTVAEFTLGHGGVRIMTAHGGVMHQ